MNKALLHGSSAAIVLCFLLGCSSNDSGSSDASFQSSVESGVHDTLLEDMGDLIQAATKLQADAPLPADRGWDATLDADAITQMKADWAVGRTAYEKMEGAVAPIFPQLDISLDARYDDFLSLLGGNGDPDPFDDMGVTGMHAIERILYADSIPQRVVDFEDKLPGYQPAAFPATAAQAAEFQSRLCAKFVTDAMELQNEWAPSHIDLGSAFKGLISLMNEQQEKVSKASTGEEESRYSQHTMDDIRDNLSGTKIVYELFQPWIVSKSGGTEIDDQIEAGFTSLAQTYAMFPGDTIPEPPATWSSFNPTPDDLATPFGQLFTAVEVSVDPNTPGSVVYEMNAAAALIGLPQFSATQ
ncbi:MAG TPA: imelysin family protein [Polyangiaceae bacterium]|nr:imelysin family protein [Polyangiaceae bacterium]